MKVVCRNTTKSDTMNKETNKIYMFLSIFGNGAMGDLKAYTTVLGLAEDEFEEKKSRFIGEILPITSEEEAVAFIAAQKTKYWDANHVTYGYVLREGGIRRYSDSGEPQGTAGIPISEVIVKSGLTDVVITVTRYFGGTKLGAGGLVRAYSHGASIAIAAAEKTTLKPCTTIAMDLDYGQYGGISRMLPKYAHKVLSSDFGVIVRMEVLLEDDELETFKKELTELTSATVHPYEGEKILADLGR